jgi:ABC-type uncharacterized transport system ATPase subunit
VAVRAGEGAGAAARRRRLHECDEASIRFHDQEVVRMQLTVTSSEYDAVRHILTAPSIARRTAPYLGECDFDFAGLNEAARTMSGGEALLVRIAQELWKAEKVTGLWELPRRLDDASFRRVLEALAGCRGRLTAAGPRFQLAV